MNEILPLVRNLIACEDIRVDPNNPRSVTLVNLITAIRSLENPAYPLLYRELCVFAQLTDCRGSADVGIRIIHEDTGQFAYPGPRHSWTAPMSADPLEVVGVRFRIRNLNFPEPGLYWIQLWYNGNVLAQQPLILR
ncbi:MAG: hypothetical protein HY000_38415 [Planctomycetes bacterium]|nr:hypothetical protein [Planctomycetota bacterium]